jgi:hypothetical protein
VSKGGRWLEADSGSTIAEGQIGGMMELQGSRQIEACARRYHPFTRHMGFGEGRCNIDARAFRPLSIHGGYTNGLLARLSSGNRSSGTAYCPSFVSL